MMSELNKKEQHKKILNDLTSSDSQTVLKSINSLREEGLISDIPALLDIALDKKDPQITKAIWNLLIDIKEKKASESIIMAIQDEKYSPIQKDLVAVCWESSLNFSEHLEIFVDLLITGNFETSFEAFTVIENMTGEVSDERKQKQSQKLKDAIAEVNQERKTFLHEAIHIVKEISIEEK